MSGPLIRPRVPPFQPRVDGPWDGATRPPVDPGTRNKQPPRIRPRRFEHGPDAQQQTHEERVVAMIGGVNQ